MSKKDRKKIKKQIMDLKSNQHHGSLLEQWEMKNRDKNRVAKLSKILYLATLEQN